jgi:hypothetical protein
MKNIIYGLGQDFWRNLEFQSEILKDTIAHCDADKAKLEYAVPLGIPTIAPAQLTDLTAKALKDNIYIYIYDHLL